jgi:hypothetical protein
VGVVPSSRRMVPSRKFLTTDETAMMSPYWSGSV